MHIAFDETNQNMQESFKIDTNDEVSNIQQIDNGLENKIEETGKPLEIQSTGPQNQSTESRASIEVINPGLPREWRVPKNLSLDNVIGQVQKGVSTRRSLNQFFEHMAFLSQVEPKTT